MYVCCGPCRFLDKMYSLSSSESLVQFTRNPRAYLLPPQPRIPCKVCVVGPPTSGKTALAHLVAEYYNAMVRTCTCIYTHVHVHVYMSLIHKAYGLLMHASTCIYMYSVCAHHNTCIHTVHVHVHKHKTCVL